MPKFNVVRDMIVDKSSAEVFAEVRDFCNWSEWSPWIIHEPKAEVVVSGTPGSTGHKQEWKGSYIGSGTLEIVELAEAKSIDYALEFIQPWKSRAKTSFTFEDLGGKCKVTWSLQSSVPFFMFFIKEQISAFIGSDYERGLSMLKEKLETGAVLSSLAKNGVVACEAFSYFGRRKICSLNSIGPAMEETFAALKEDLSKKALPSEPDFVLAFYHKHDMLKQTSDFTCALAYKKPVSEAPEKSEGIVQGRIPEHRALNVDHLGPYRHLGNAWTGAMLYLRTDKMRSRKEIPMYEIYKTMPGAVEEKDILTSIFLPVK